MARWLLAAAALLPLLVGARALGQTSVEGFVAPGTLPPLSNQTTATCGTTDGPISPASGTLPAWPHNLLIQNPYSSVAHVFVNWAGGNSVTAGLDFAPGSSDERAAIATPHCSTNTGSVTIEVGW